MAQIPNNVSGPDIESSWPVEDINRLRRFLCFGTESANFTDEEKELSRENAQCIIQLIENGKGGDVVKEIVHFSTNGKSAKQKPVIFALAVCARLCKDLKAKQAAYKALSDVCKIPAFLFHFVNYAEKLSGETSGWGRAQRKAITSWYNKQKPSDLAVAVTKYRQREGWSHIDILRLAHVKPENEATALLLRYVTKGLEEAKKKYEKDDASDEVKLTFKYLEAVETLKHSRDEHQAARLIEQHKLAKEHVPTWLINSKEVWRALLQNMPIDVILKHLGKMTSLGLMDPLTNDSCAPLIKDKLKDVTLVKEARLHPYSLLLALKTYEKGKGEKGKLEWTPNGGIVDTLTQAFYASFKALEPTGKRYLIAVDVSGSMQYGGVSGSPQITPAAAAGAMAMVTARTEQQYQMVAFSKDMVPVKLNAQMALQEVCHAISEVPMGSTDCSKPILWAMENKKTVDVFIVYTDCDTWEGHVQPIDALIKYRKAMNIANAMLIVCALTSSGFQLAHPNDAGMLDVAGFDARTPHVMRSFIMGEL